MATIDITELFIGDTWAFTGSCVTHGRNSAEETWANAKVEASRAPLLTVENDGLDAMRHWAKSTGAWDKEEIAAWDDTELELDDMDAWLDYEAGAHAGQWSGSIYTQDGHVYYELEG